MKTYVRTRTFISWDTMIQRTTNPKNTNFPRYGGSGIGVCEEWRVFKNFLRDMGERPKGMSLDRVDNTLGYSMENCKWSTASEQVSNRRGYSKTGEKFIYSESGFYRVAVPGFKKKAFSDLSNAVKQRNEWIKQGN